MFLGVESLRLYVFKFGMKNKGPEKGIYKIKVPYFFFLIIIIFLFRKQRFCDMWLMVLSIYIGILN